MINLKFNLTTHYKECHYHYLEYEGDFEITVDSKVFFKDPHFSILEFLRDAFEWVNCGDKTTPMLYNCIDTEENPLISFVETNGKWRIQSPWQKFECQRAFARKELEKAIIDLDRNVKEQISNQKN